MERGLTIKGEVGGGKRRTISEPSVWVFHSHVALSSATGTEDNHSPVALTTCLHLPINVATEMHSLLCRQFQVHPDPRDHMKVSYTSTISIHPKYSLLFSLGFYLFSRVFSERKGEETSCILYNGYNISMEDQG